MIPDSLKQELDAGLAEAAKKGDDALEDEAIRLANALRTRAQRTMEATEAEPWFAAASHVIEVSLARLPDRIRLLSFAGSLSLVQSMRVANRDERLALLGKAEKLYERVLELKPDHINTLGNLGVLLKNRGDLQSSRTDRLMSYSEAERLYRRVLDEQPDHVSTLCNLGVVLRNRGAMEPSRTARLAAYGDAELCYRRVLELEPNHVDALRNLGVLQQARGDLELAEAARRSLYGDAEERYRRVLELQPDDVKTLCNLGVLLRALGDLESSRAAKLEAYVEAETLYRRVLALQPDDPDTLGNLGVLLRGRGNLELSRTERLRNYDEAEACYNRVLELQPNRLSALGNLGLLAFDRSQLESGAQRRQSLAAAVGYATRVLLLDAIEIRAMRILMTARLDALQLEDGGMDWPSRVGEAAALLKRRRAFAAVTTDPHFRTELSSAAWPLGPLGAVSHLRAGDLAGAVAHLDANLAMSLAEALATPERRLVELEQAGEHAAARAFVAARDALNQRRQERVELLQAPKGDNKEAEAARQAAIAGLGREITGLEQQFDAAIDEIRKFEGFADFLRPGGDIDLIHAAAKQRPLVYLCASPWGGHALVVHGEAIDDVPLPDLKDEAVVERLEAWRADYQELREAFTTSDARRSEVRFLPAPDVACPPPPAEDPRHEAALVAFDAATRELCRWLGEVAMAPLLARLQALGATRVVLLPSGRLTWLPLHAAIVGGSDARPVLAIERLELSYAANARLARESSARLARPAATPPAAAAILDPAYAKPEHRHAHGPAEVAMLEQHARDGRLQLTCHAGPRARLVLGETVEPDAFAVADLATQQLLHLGCHAHTAHGEIFASSLQLAAGADGVDQMVTVETVLDHWPVEGLRLVVLSCCEGAMAAEQSFDELISLQTAFAQGGAAAVVGAMWAVRDDHTAALMQHFYATLLTDPALDPAKALATAQVRLLDATPEAFPTIAAFKALQG